MSDHSSESSGIINKPSILVMKYLCNVFLGKRASLLFMREPAIDDLISGL